MQDLNEIYLFLLDYEILDHSIISDFPLLGLQNVVLVNQ